MQHEVPDGFQQWAPEGGPGRSPIRFVADVCGFHDVKRLLEADELSALSAEVRRTCGVYFLLSDEWRVLYVGQSTNIESRVRDHMRTKVFARFAFVECETSDLNALEVGYVLKFRPPLNRMIPLGRVVLSDEQRRLVDELKVSEGRGRAKADAVYSKATKPTMRCAWCGGECVFAETVAALLWRPMSAEQCKG